MKSEKQKMISGELYNPLDQELVYDREQTRLLLKKLNGLGEDQQKEKWETLRQLIPNADADIWIQTPFFCDYGYNIKTGEKVFFNFNCIVLDVAQVLIGHRTLFGPNVQLYTATHPMDYKERAAGLEFAKPITVGDDVWIGGSAILCPGISIGDRSVIGAGSVVTKDIPSDAFAAGNPCRVIRKIN